MGKIKLIVISPEKKVLEADCLSATLPTTEGQITVLPHHSPLFSLLKAGEVIARTSDGEISLAVGGGFVNVTGDKITVLVEFGTKSEEIDEARAQEAKHRAEEILKSHADEQSSALAQAALARSLLELKITQRRKKG
jgi:F-type H+-transporting ATPase subunit epsilon